MMTAALPRVRRIAATLRVFCVLPTLLATGLDARVALAQKPPSQKPPSQKSGAVKRAPAPAPRGKGGDRVKPDTHTSQGEPPPPQLGSSFGNALRIARMLNEERTIARLLTRQGLRRDASDADLVEVVRAFETLGEPEGGVKFLRDRMRLFPNEKRLRPLLAAHLSRNGDSAGAVAVWKEQIQVFGKDSLSLADTHAYARDLSRTGDTDAAYAVLTAVRDKAPADAVEYWTDLGTLAWDRDDDDVATVAYEKVYAGDPRTPHVGIRLVALYLDAGRIDDASSIALAEHVRTGDAKPLLAVAHHRAEKGEWAAVKELLDTAASAPKPEGAPPLSQNVDFLILRGDSRRELRDLPGAADAYRRALAVAPETVLARANLLWVLLELGDKPRLKQLASAWSGPSIDEPLMWAPMALALARVDLVKESIPFFEKQLKANPRDGRVLLDLAEVLGKLDRHELARDARVRAVIYLRKEAVKATRVKDPTPDELHLVESAASVVRERSGNPQGERWLAAMRSSNPSFRGQEETALDWYLGTERPGYARLLLAHKTFRSGELRKYRLALALSEDDLATANDVLERARPGDLTPEERMHAAVLLGNDRAAAFAIGEGLGSGKPGADEAAMRRELERIYFMHAPHVRAGVNYMHITGLDILGPTASVAHDAFSGRMTYSAIGARMTDRSTLLGLRDSVLEGQVGLSYRLMRPRGVTEAGAAFNYQDGAPLGRFSLFDQRLLTSRFGISTDLRFGSRIDDTSFLRLAGARNALGLGARYDERLWYVTAEIEGREDQTRQYQHLSWDLVETVEAGVKILTREPHLSIGVQAQASQRDNRTDLPSTVAFLVTPDLGVERALPPSFQLVGGVVHLSRGDFLERYRPERSTFPRYDCELAFGALFPSDTALHALCGVSVRAPGGFATALAFYNRGIAGIRNSENAEVGFSYTIPF